MKPSSLLSALLATVTTTVHAQRDMDMDMDHEATAAAAAAAAVEGRTAPVYIQPISSTSPPTLLAELRYDNRRHARDDRRAT